MTHLKALLVVLCSAILLENVSGAVDVAVQNKNVERTVDLTSQVVKISLKITATTLASGNVKSYTFVIPTEERKHLAFISVKDASKKELKLTERETENGLAYDMTFPTPAPSMVIYIETTFTQMLQPYPAEITQSEKQFMRYFGNAYFYSPFKTISQKTTVQLPSRSVESYSPVKPVSQGDSNIVYGPYENLAAFSSEAMVVHYENHSPFMTVKRLERVIEVSHWGNIAIEETIDILHTGAKLKGSFSRYDFQKDGRNGQASVKSYKTILPASANSIYYRDTNGNISTSAMRVLKDSVELDIRPRFPLFGGWRTHYTLGYNVPSFEYLFHSGGSYMLKLRLVDHIFDDMVIEDALIKIILPEGCTNIKLITPYSVNRRPDTLHYTYLDTFGRPVITFTKQNLVEQHIHDFNLKYNFSKVMLLQEPLLVVFFLYFLFVVLIIWMKLDFAIVTEKEHHHKD